MIPFPQTNSRLARVFRDWFAAERAIDLKSPERAEREGGAAVRGNEDAAASSSLLEVADPVWLAVENPRPSPLTSMAPMLYTEAVLLRLDREKGEAIVVTQRWKLRIVASLDRIVRRKPGEIAPGRKGFGL